jgi:hypothetical protein
MPTFAKLAFNCVGRRLLTILAAITLARFGFALAKPVFAMAPLVSHVSRYVKRLATQSDEGTGGFP